MANTENITVSLYETLKSECDEANVRIGTVCREAGIDRSIVEKWKGKDPKTIQILNRFRATLQKIKSQTNE